MKLYKQMLLFTLLLILTQVSCTRQNTKAADANNVKQEKIGPAKTVEMKTITDHAGHEVEIPASPKRIGSLHYPITVMLHELDAPMIGSSTRIKKPENIRYIRSGYELFGLDFSKTGWADYGSFGEDLEQVKSSKPDLIIGGLYHQKFYEQLSKMAPTILIDYEYENYADLANWIGKKDAFDAKENTYQKKLQAVKAKFGKDTSQQTVAYFHLSSDGKFAGWFHYGAMTKVAYDLGIKPHPFYIKEFDNGAVRDYQKFSIEIIGEILDADYLMMTYRGQYGVSRQKIFQDLDKWVPGWKSYTKAYQNNSFILTNRETTSGTSFRSYDLMLDEFAKYAK